MRLEKRFVSLRESKFSGLYVAISTVCGIGFAKVAPGTWGSIPGLLLAWGLYKLSLPIGGGFYTAIFLLITLSLLSYFATYCIDKTEKMWETHDPKSIVVDEVLGQALCLAFFEPTLISYSLGFLLFRFFDILKPWPISWIDKHVNTAFGTLADDLVAGIFAGICLKILLAWL